MLATRTLAPSKPALADDRHSLMCSAFAHLAPGVLIALFYVAATPWVMARGFPPLFAMLLAMMFIAIPVELGDLLRRGWRRNGRLSLEGVVLYRRPLPAWQYVAFTAGFLVVAFFVSGATGLIETAIASLMSRWLPGLTMLTSPAAYAGYSRSVLQTMAVFYLTLNDVAAPVVEELYFRGYLLPRLSRFGGWAPIIGAALFTLYHFWQPYAYLSIFVVLTPLIWLVWRKQNLYLGIAMHCALNTVGAVMLLAGIFAQ